MHKMLYNQMSFPKHGEKSQRTLLACDIMNDIAWIFGGRDFGGSDYLLLWNQEES